MVGGENDMKIADGQQHRALAMHPFRFFELAALRAMPVAATVVFEFKSTALVAFVEMPAQFRRAARFQRPHYLRLLRRRMVFFPVSLPEFPQHRRHFKFRPARFDADKSGLLCHFQGLSIAFLVQRGAISRLRIPNTSSGTIHYILTPVCLTNQD